MERNHSSEITLPDDDPTDDIQETQETASNSGTAEAEAIRRQVHHYFSDENLARDSYFKSMLRSHENQSIPVHKIHAFKAMQQFQPLQVVIDALKGSDVLDVVQDETDCRIRRKVPYTELEKTSKQKLPKPTGFEEYYSDAPITPAEYEHEKGIYDPELNFALRIETAIQKYQAKRRFHPKQSNVFIKFLKFGGISTGPKQFSGGIDAEFLENATATDIAWAKASSFVDDDKYETGAERKWDVDFEGIAKAFLSSLAPAQFGIATGQDVKLCTGILRNFYNYILYHEVCPEYTSDIFAAREVCNLAESELDKTRQLVRELPGDFNRACSTLFGGFYSSAGWIGGNIAAEGEYDSMSERRAKRIVAYGMAAYGSDEDYYGRAGDDDDAATPSRSQVQQRVFGQSIAAYEDDGAPVGLEVVDRIFPDASTRRLYDAVLPRDGDAVDKQQHITPLGKLVCKPWEIPVFTPADVAPAANHTTSSAQRRPEVYEIWLEEDLLRLCFAGMKLEAVVARLSSARPMLDRVCAVHCSFYTLSNNELLLQTPWKPPCVYTRAQIDEMYARHQTGLLDETDEHEHHDGNGNGD